MNSAIGARFVAPESQRGGGRLLTIDTETQRGASELSGSCRE
jgi:hypothetical protein